MSSALVCITVCIAPIHSRLVWNRNMAAGAVSGGEALASRRQEVVACRLTRRLPVEMQIPQSLRFSARRTRRWPLRGTGLRPQRLWRRVAEAQETAILARVCYAVLGTLDHWYLIELQGKEFSAYEKRNFLVSLIEMRGC